MSVNVKTQNSKLKTDDNFIDKVLKLLYHALFFFTPLIMFSQTSELFEFNKLLFIYLITSFIVFFWILKVIFSKKIIFEKTILFPALILFLLSQILSTFFSIDKHTSIFGYYGRFNGGLFSIITYVILFFGLVSNFQNSFIFSLLRTSLISSVITILWGLPGKIGLDLSCYLFTGQLTSSCWTDQFRPAERVFSTLGQPNWFGSYLAINFFIGLFFYIKTTKWQGGTMKQILYTLYLILNFTAILFTRSRSSLLSVAVGLFLFLLYLLITKRKEVKKYLILLLILALLIIVFKSGIQKIDSYFIKNNQVKTQVKVNKPQSPLNEVTESFDIRKIVWQGAVDLGFRYPLFGSGVETFAYSYYFVRPQEHNLTSEWDFLYNKAHNEYLNYFATTGFTGLIAYLLFISLTFYLFISSILKAKKNDENQSLILCLFLSYVTILITNFFGFSTTVTSLFFYLLPALIIILRKDEGSGTTIKANLFGMDKKQKLAFAVNVSLITFVIISIIFYFLADIKYNQANNFARLGNYSEAATLLQQSLRLHYEHVYEDKFSSVLANLAYIAADQKEPKSAEKFMMLSKYYNNKTLVSSPYNVLYWKTKAKDYYLFYQINLDNKNLEAGLQALKEGVKLSPTDPKLPYTMSLYYSQLNDEEKDTARKNYYQKLSLYEIDKSIGLKSNFYDAYFLKGQLLKKYGQNEEAKKVFQYILNNLNPNDEQVKKELNNI